MGSTPASLILPAQGDNDNRLLWKLLTAVVAVIRGDSGILMRGSVTVDTSTPLAAVGPHFVSSATFTRPNDTSAYAAKDVVSNSTSATTLLSFSSVARSVGKSGYITKGRLVTDNKSATPRLRLWLYSISNPTMQADNSPFRLLWANRASRIGYIDFPALTTEDATNSDSAAALATEVRLAFTTDAADTKLYGVLEALDAFTPTANQNFYVELEGEQS